MTTSLAAVPPLSPSVSPCSAPICVSIPAFFSPRGTLCTTSWAATDSQAASEKTVAKYQDDKHNEVASIKVEIAVRIGGIRVR